MPPFKNRPCRGLFSCFLFLLIVERFGRPVVVQGLLVSHRVHHLRKHKTPLLLLLVGISQRDASSSDSDQKDRRIVQRWNGKHKRASKKLCEVTKAKKMNLELSVLRRDGSIVTKTVQKKRQETLQHVLTKAILWKLFCDEYQSIEIEQDIGDQDYLPDVISLDADGRPLFWGESGRMKVHKAMDLMKRYPDAHIVHCRWDMELSEIEAPLMEHLQELFDSNELGNLPDRSGRFTICSVPLDLWRFIDEETGYIHLSQTDLEWKELVFPSTKSPGAGNSRSWT